MSILHRRRATNTRSCIQMLCMTFDYCNALSCTALRPATSRNFNVCRTTQLWSCSKCQDDPTSSRCCIACTGCQLIRESSTRWRWSHWKSSALQRQPISADTYSPTIRNLRSSDTRLLCQPFTKTYLARRGFRYSAPAIWNSLPRTVLESLSITVFKSMLKTHLFDLARTKQQHRDLCYHRLWSSMAG